jgi:hypothetical protein
MACQNRVVEPSKEIKRLDGTAVRCEADRCEEPALFLFIAAGTSHARWAYCEEHARIRAQREHLNLPRSVAPAFAFC